jgi:hypothetical protein
MTPAISSTEATRTLKVSGRRETAAQSSFSMMECRVLYGYQDEARGGANVEIDAIICQWSSKIALF